MAKLIYYHDGDNKAVNALDMHRLDIDIYPEWRLAHPLGHEDHFYIIADDALLEGV